MTPLRFAMVTTFYPPWNFGGDGMGVQRLSQALVRRGHHVTVIHDADAYQVLNGGPPAGTGSPDDGVDVVTLRSRLPALSCLLTQQTGRPVVNGRRLRALLDGNRFDVINYHNVSLVGGPAVLSIGHGVKLYMAHEHWLVCPTHVLWRHGREPCPGRECLRCQLHAHRPPQWWRGTGLLERQLPQVDAFIAMSRFSRDKHREFGFPRDMEVVPYFLPATDTQPADGASPHPRPYFLFVGRLERIKGLDDVLPLFRGDGPADLVIAGDGDYGAVLRAIAGDAPRIRFLGRVAPGDLARYYRHALALLVPSVCFETFGIIVIEAFRQGTPVLARRIGPLPELVETSGGGATFATAEELDGLLRRLEGDAAYRVALGRAGAAAFAQHWSEDAVIPQYLAVVRRAAERRGMHGIAEALRS